MNKYLLSVLVIGAFVFYSWRVQTETKSITAVTPTSTPKPTSKIAVSPSLAPVTQSIPKSSPPPTPVPTEKPVGIYRDGTYTGNVVDAVYGDVQVQVTVRDGSMSDVVALHYPDHHDYSREINPAAVAALSSEAISIQKADVDIYSGATQTSKGFRTSLQSALDQAKI